MVMALMTRARWDTFMAGVIAMATRPSEDL
jgi:hypothetical protein